MGKEENERIITAYENNKKQLKKGFITLEEYEKIRQTININSDNVLKMKHIKLYGMNKYNYLTNRTTKEEFINILLSIPSYQNSGNIADKAKEYEQEYKYALYFNFTSDREQILKDITNRYNKMIVEETTKYNLINKTKQDIIVKDTQHNINNDDNTYNLNDMRTYNILNKLIETNNKDNIDEVIKKHPKILTYYSIQTYLKNNKLNMIHIKNKVCSKIKKRQQLINTC